MTRRLLVYILVVAASVAAVAGLIRVGNARLSPQAVQTVAEPPNNGRICLAINGGTRNSRNAMTKIVTA